LFMKGISPLMASILLIAITLSVAMVAFNAFKGIASSQAGSASDLGESASDCAFKAIEITNVTINTTGSSQEILMILENKGNGPLTMATGFVADTDGNKCPFNVTNIVLEEGSIAAYRNTSGCGIFSSSCTDFNRAEISTKCGNAHDSYEAAPTCLA
jgi:flagellin-like protein